MLIDIVTITVRAGDGGHGGSTLSQTAQTAKGGPDGGNGGNGGSIYAMGSTNVTDLQEFRFKKKIVAENGISGTASKKNGKNADDVVILLPLGTLITNLETGLFRKISNQTQKHLLVQGGIGGRGNVEFKTATNRTPLHGEPGSPGQVKRLKLDLRMIAQVGLVGLPNAGKSSLLRVLTNATPAVGDYPFTTLSPNIGMFGSHPIADIPGIIEGASKGKGLGTTFLKHIEKTKMLIHCIDLGNTDPQKAYDLIHQEISAFNTKLQNKPEIVLLTKTDLVDAPVVANTKELFRKRGLQVMELSIYDAKSIQDIKTFLESRLAELY